MRDGQQIKLNCEDLGRAPDSSGLRPVDPKYAEVLPIIFAALDSPAEDVSPQNFIQVR